MKPDLFTKLCLLTIIGLLTVIAFRTAGERVHAAETAAYKVISTAPATSGLERALNKAHAEGWEVVQVWANGVESINVVLRRAER